MNQQPKHSLPNTLYLSLVPLTRSRVYRCTVRFIGAARCDFGRSLSAHTRLPSTRDLAAIWGVSRNTLRNAFEQLIAEGYVEAVVGRGTFVLPQETVRVRPPKKQNGDRIRPISHLGRHLEFLGRGLQPVNSTLTAFDVGMPDFDIFPHKIWNRTVQRCLRRNPVDHGLRVNGLRILREAVASYLVSARGVRCSADQVDIVPGSVSGMYMASLALLNPGDHVWMENPVHRAAHGLVLYRQAKRCLCPLTNRG